MIFKYLEYPNEKEWNKIIKNSPVLKNLYLKINLKIDNNSEISNYLYYHKFVIWIKQFNNKLFNIYMTYIFLMHYFNKGIPDDKHLGSTDKNNKTVQSLTPSAEKQFWIKYLFCYYVEVFYSQAFSTWDYIYHLINAYYQMNFKPNRDFKKSIMCNLKIKNKTLYAFLKNKEKGKVFIKARKLRNDIMHNYPPHRSEPIVYSEYKRDKNVRKTHLGVKKFIKSKEFQTNIYQFLESLSTALEELKMNLESSL